VVGQPRLFPWPGKRSLAPTLDRSAILQEVASGLRNERGRLAEAAENAAFADLGSRDYIERREAETEFDYAGRVKRASGLMHQAINRLCSHTYNPGPMRTAIDAPQADELLQQVYEQCHIDAVMHEAERLSTINDVAAIECKATDDPEYPIDLQLWGSEEFAVFLDPDDPRKPYAVVTIDQFDEQTRYRLYFDDAVHTFLTAKAGSATGQRTDGGVIAFEVPGSPEPNTYGVLPFAFVPYRAPVRRFWTCGPGSFLKEAERVINDQLSDMAELIQKYQFPIALLKGVGPEFNPEIGPGRFLRLIQGDSTYNGDGFAPGGQPAAEYLQAQLQIEAIWQDIKEYMGQVAEAIDLPPSALRLDYTDAPSGISILIRTLPLLTRARQRRPIYQWAETCLARLICCCYARHYGKPALEKNAKALRVLLAWPEPRVPIPGPERDETDSWEISLGIKSRIQVVQERYGLTADQALERLKQVAKEEEEARAILPQRETPAKPEDEPDGDQQPDQADDDPESEETD
jgi:hypothetical protein